MCGIAGILRVYEPGETPPPVWESIPEEWLDILDASIVHRGPDGAGRFRDRRTLPDGRVVDIALVHRRLSILDHAGGRQPMVSLGKGLGISDAGGTEAADLVAVAFNGCIYNHRDLRRELEGAGHVFSTDHSDTEVLVHGWREWGQGLFSRLEGMYAAAFWSGRGAELTLARDTFGEKPLYQLVTGGGSTATTLAFASSVAGLARLEHAIGGHGPCDLRPAVDRVRWWIKFGCHQSSPLPLIDSVWPAFVVRSTLADDAVRPGHRILRSDEVDTALRAAVHDRLEADVPLGCFLSGGIDSSLIARYASEARPDLTAFTVRMPSGAFDESAPAARVAKVLGIRHEVLECEPNPSEDLPRLIRQLGLPFGDSSLLPTYWVSRAAAARIRVALAGDGGDELFLGYDRQRVLGALAVLERLPQGVRSMLAAMTSVGRDPKSKRTRLARLLHAVASSGYTELVAIFPSPMDAALFAGTSRPYRNSGLLRGMSAREAKMLALSYDRLVYLPQDLLRKTDTASMAVALEVRAPFLDRRVVKMAIDATIESLTPGGRRKGLLRDVARRYFPDDIVDRPKMGFAIPIGEWFRSNYGGMRDLLLDHLRSSEPFGPPSLGIELNMAYVERLLREHDEAGASSLFPWKGRDHSQRLYMLLVLSIWAKWLGELDTE